MSKGNRLITAVTLLLPGAALTCLALTLFHRQFGHYATHASSLGGTALVGGVLALITLIFVALISVFIAPFVRMIGPPLRFNPWLMGGVAGFIGIGASLLLTPIADAIIPPGLDFRYAFVDVTRWALGLGLGATVSVVILRLKGISITRSLWLFAIVSLAWRFYLDTPIRAVFLRYEHLLDITLLAIAVFAFWPLGQRTKRWINVSSGVALLIMSAVFVYGSGTWIQARNELEFAHRGPSQLADLFRGILDFDGDGYSALLGGLDCDDTDPMVYPLAIEIVGNAQDENCDGSDLANAPTEPPIPPARPTQTRSMVLVTVDALRADNWNYDLPDGSPLMPNLVKLTTRGAHFTNTYVHAPNTDWSLRSLIAGVVPMDFTNGEEVLFPALSIPQRLNALGYVSLTPGQVQSLPGLPPIKARDAHGYQQSTSAQFTDHTLAAFERLKLTGRPFFLWVHYMDPHSDYVTYPNSPIPDQDQAENRYRAEAWQTDHEIGRLIAGLDQAHFFDDGLLAVAADHGENFGDQGRFSHSVWTNNTVLHVSSLMVGSGIPAGTFSTRIPISDLTYTLFEQATGLPLPGDAQSLTPIWSGRETADRDVWFVGFYEPRALRGVISGLWTYTQAVRSGAESLRKGLDPKDYATTNPKILAQLRTQLQARWSQDLNDVVLKQKSIQRRPRRRRLPPANHLP